MNITGQIPTSSWALQPSGAFYVASRGEQDGDGRGREGQVMNFDASRTWSGYTSTDGSHVHSMSLDTTGGGKGHTHTLDGAAHEHSVNVERPPFYRMAYFVKLPE